ncbi:MAG: peptidoglycan editing factor PgeF [Oscillospiraceae bacterium]|nr:peptidoglycan editing factor PgeF [Oscillospiraceae bacterium]MBQ6902467.1 peptidoglycan editing factor PgeF [Oscillospiraceae bacterium]
MRHGFTKHNKNGVVFLSVPSFDETGLCESCFSTRLGGVSKAPLDSMNLGFNRGDDRLSVMENHDLLGKAAGLPLNRLVAFSQIHENGVCVATSDDAGEAFLSEKREFDSVITATPELPVATYHADCVPVFLLDPVRRVCGVAHAGWRGTALKTPARAVSEMVSRFGCDASDILAAIGPSIGSCCFETHSDVPDAMLSSFGDGAKPFIESLENGKFRVSLPGLNTLSLLECGIHDENITLSDECTCCKSDLYWSHRKTGGIRGTMAAIIMLKEGV